eukprot:TRINITY_DN12959_c1_g1_i1.p1 TRINITY_DN12959_c1_g1~~TRINITY_DN12959_c1_g1_i1.p1  ORF type:complete len:217 (+),score=49.80 TRINITY_DN12959_c1_g1_i1:77-727(+)
MAEQQRYGRVNWAASRLDLSRANLPDGHLIWGQQYQYSPSHRSPGRRRGEGSEGLHPAVLQEVAADLCISLAVLLVCIVTLAAPWVDTPLSAAANLRDLSRSGIAAGRYHRFALVTVAFLLLTCLSYGVVVVTAVARASGIEGSVPLVGQAAVCTAAFFGFFVCIFTWLTVEPWDGKYYTACPFFAFFIPGLVPMLVHAPLKCGVFPRLQANRDEV